jgi:hypothetical protein
MNKEYTINEELVYSTLSVPRPAMIIHGYDDLVIEDLKDENGILGKNLARKMDVDHTEIAKWTKIHRDGKYNDVIHCPPTYTDCPVKGRDLKTGFCKTKGADGADKKTIRGIEVEFRDYDGTSAAEWEAIARSNENRPLEDRDDFVKNDRTDVDIVDTLKQLNISLSTTNDDGVKVPTDKFLNKKLKQLLVPESRWPALKNLYRDELGINQDQNVRTVTSSKSDEEKFTKEVKKLFPNKNILFVTMGQSNHQKMPTDLIRKVLDAKLENNPYDMIIMKHYGCTNLAGLKRARIRDRTFFTDDDGWFCGDLRRFNSPLTGPWPEIKFEPQTDKEIVEWKQKEILI